MNEILSVFPSDHSFNFKRRARICISSYILSAAWHHESWNATQGMWFKNFTYLNKTCNLGRSSLRKERGLQHCKSLCRIEAGNWRTRGSNCPLGSIYGVISCCQLGGKRQNTGYSTVACWWYILEDVSGSMAHWLPCLLQKGPLKKENNKCLIINISRFPWGDIFKNKGFYIPGLLNT